MKMTGMLVVSLEGGFPLLRNFSLGKHLKFTRVNEIEAMYERPRVNVKVERGSTFTFLRDPPYIIYTRKIYVRTHEKVMRQWKSTLSFYLIYAREFSCVRLRGKKLQILVSLKVDFHC